MASLSETRPHVSEPLIAPACNTRLALLLALGAAVLIGIALNMERPTAPDGIENATSNPTAERTFDGRGKWTGY